MTATMRTTTPASRTASATCGDGFLHEGVEACDDGNDLDTDARLDGCGRSPRRGSPAS